MILKVQFSTNCGLRGFKAIENNFQVTRYPFSVGWKLYNQYNISRSPCNSLSTDKFIVTHSVLQYKYSTTVTKMFLFFGISKFMSENQIYIRQDCFETEWCSVLKRMVHSLNFSNLHKAFLLTGTKNPCKTCFCKMYKNSWLDMSIKVGLFSLLSYCGISSSWTWNLVC